MKEVKLIEEAIRSSNEDGIRQMLEQFLRANTVVWDEKLDLSKFVGKDEMRPAMTGCPVFSMLRSIHSNFGILVRLLVSKY